MIMPLEQNAHCAACSSIKARCNACRRLGLPCPCPLSANPSSVRTSAPPGMDCTSAQQARTARPLTSTVQTPHCSAPQPILGPTWSSLLRSTNNSGSLPSATGTDLATPLSTMFSDVGLGMSLLPLQPQSADAQNTSEHFCHFLCEGAYRSPLRSEVIESTPGWGVTSVHAQITRESQEASERTQASRMHM